MSHQVAHSQFHRCLLGRRELSALKKGHPEILKGTCGIRKGPEFPLTKEQKKNYVLCSFKTEGHCHGPRRYRRGSRFSVTHPVPGHGGRLGRGVRGIVSGRVSRVGNTA